MSDFDTFVNVTSVGNNIDDDPAAEFLAREQNQLAGLEEDFDFTHNNIPSSKLNESTDLNELNELNEPYANGDSDEVLQLNGPSSNGIDTDFVSRKSHSPVFDKYQIPREEPEKIRKWREEQQRLLEQKDDDESMRKEELRQTAKHELEEWYLRYNEQLEKSKHNNRNAEREWVKERDAEVPGQEWEKIARMCDFNPKSTRNAKDTSRMRSILLQLKQNPPVNSNS